MGRKSRGQIAAESLRMLDDRRSSEEVDDEHPAGDGAAATMSSQTETVADKAPEAGEKLDHAAPSNVSYTSIEPSVLAPVLTIDQLAEYLQVPKRTIYVWRTRGEGPRAIKVGRELRFRAQDVNAWLDALSFASSA